MSGGETPARTADEHASAGLRVIVAFGVGVVAAGVSLVWMPWQDAILAGWNVAAVVFLAWVFLAVHRMNGDETASHATAEDSSRPAADLILVAASAASLVGVAFALFEASSQRGGEKVLATVVASLTVVLSWAAVHTVFMLRYASLYYRDGVGGIEFPDQGRPDYGDFAYLALTIGMTYQVSDTPLKDKQIRMTALRHAMLSFVFGTGVLAMTINVVAGLIRG